VYLHREEVIKAAERGKHILCEKPLALTYKDALEMLNAVESNRLKFQVGFMMHYHGAHREIAGLIKEKKIGTPVYARAQLTCWYPPMQNKDIKNIFKKLPYREVDTFLKEVEAFVKALIENREITENAGAAGVHSMKLADAAYSSAKTGCFIEV